MREMFKWFVVAPEFWLTMLLLGGLTILSLATIIWRDARHSIGRWRHRRMAVPRTLVVGLIALLFTGCATSYRPKVTGPLPFAFTPTPEQCAQLLKERRTYRATEKTAGYVAGAGALVSVLALGFVDAKAVPAVASGVSLLAGGTLTFTGSQVESLDEELRDGGCSR